MLWRHLCLVRAWSAAGLVSGLLVLGTTSATAQTASPADPESTPPPAAAATETVDLLKADRAGTLSVTARGQGQDRVRLTIRNTSGKRLNVVIPPGLVASATASQPGGRGGGLQSMGLGLFSNRPGSFGLFQGGSTQGFQSVSITDSDSPRSAVTVPAGESLDFTIPAVCLNYGLATPTPRNVFKLMDVEEYTQDVRVRKALRSLCLLGTSQGVAQAVMWNVCNDLPFETMVAEAGKVMNVEEIGLAARFVAAVDDSESDLVDPVTLASGRMFVRVQGSGPLAADARRLNDQLRNYRLLGLPVQTLADEELPVTATVPALYVRLVLTESKVGETRGRILVSVCTADDRWVPLGKAAFHDTSSLAVLDGGALSRSLDRALASAFVTVKPAHRSVGSTTLKVENHLPFTLRSVAVKAGGSAGAPTVPFDSVGVGPARSALLPIQAASAVIERVELNGL